MTMIKELLVTHLHAIKNEINPCTFVTVGVIIINHGNNMDIFYKLKR